MQSCLVVCRQGPCEKSALGLSVNLCGPLSSKMSPKSRFSQIVVHTDPAPDPDPDPEPDPTHRAVPYGKRNRQPNTSKSVDVHFADAVRAKTLLDDFLEELSESARGVYVRSVPVKEQDSIKRKASNDYGGDVRR